MPTHTTAPLISTDLIDDSDRERKDLGDLTSLAESISSLGLIHPIVISDELTPAGKHTLIAGGRRLATFRALGISEIPYNFRSVADEADLREAELEENLQRKDMHWTEYVSAVARVHSLRQAKVNFNEREWGLRQTGQLLGMKMSSVSNALAVARSLAQNDTEIAAASGLTDALGILLGRKQDAATKLLAQKERVTPPLATPSILGSDKPDDIGFNFDPSKSLSLNEIDREPAPFQWRETEFDLTNTILHGDCIELMSRMALEGRHVDHIVTDPPYGIDMANLGTFTDIDRVESEHDVEQNLELLPAFFKAAYNILPDTGFLVAFCDMQHFEKMMMWARGAGFKVQRWPLVWVKTHSCINNAAQYNSTKDFEVALRCRKGNATLIKPQGSSVISVNGATERKMYRNPFAKPFDLWKWCLDAVAIPGQTVLDPFAGEGSMPNAAINCGLRPVAIETSDKHYPALVENVKKAYKLVTGGKATFK